MKSWKEEVKFKEGFGTRRTPSGYKVARSERTNMKIDARDLGNMLIELCDIAAGKSDKDFDEAKSDFEDVLKMFFESLDYIRR